MIRNFRASKSWTILTLLALLFVVSAPAFALNCCCAAASAATPALTSSASPAPAASMPPCHAHAAPSPPAIASPSSRASNFSLPTYALGFERVCSCHADDDAVAMTSDEVGFGWYLIAFALLPTSSPALPSAAASSHRRIPPDESPPRRTFDRNLAGRAPPAK